MNPTWDSYLRSWARHARTRPFQHKVDQARRYVEQAPGGVDGLFLALSGGKDSAAVAGLLLEMGVEVPWAYMHTRLNFPDTLSTVDAIGQRFDWPVGVVEPDGIEKHVRDVCRIYKTPLPQPTVDGWSEWDLLAAFPTSINLMRSDTPAFAGARSRFMSVVASGNMLVAHAYASGARGSICGMRADESRGRKMRARVYGANHVFAADKQVLCCPIQWWTGEDVYAFLVDREIPIHPYYRKAYEFMGGTTPPHLLRVDLSIMGELVASLGAMAAIRAVYPDLYRKLAAVRPEVTNYV